jgi:hypothetical protein
MPAPSQCSPPARHHPHPTPTPTRSQVQPPHGPLLPLADVKWRVAAGVAGAPYGVVAGHRLHAAGADAPGHGGGRGAGGVGWGGGARATDMETCILPALQRPDPRVSSAMPASVVRQARRGRRGAPGAGRGWALEVGVGVTGLLSMSLLKESLRNESHPSRGGPGTLEGVLASRASRPALCYHQPCAQQASWLAELRRHHARPFLGPLPRRRGPCPTPTPPPPPPAHLVHPPACRPLPPVLRSTGLLARFAAGGPFAA